MKKFFVLFCIPANAIDQWIATVEPAEREKQSNELMQEWKDWITAHQSVITDNGLPLGKTKRVTAEGITDTRNDLNWYLLVEAESHEAAAELFKGHPHLKVPTAYIEVLGTSGPGMS